MSELANVTAPLAKPDATKGGMLGSTFKGRLIRIRQRFKPIFIVVAQLIACPSPYIIWAHQLAAVAPKSITRQLHILGQALSPILYRMI